MENNENTIGIIPDSSGNSGYSAKLMRKSSTANSLILIIFTIFMIGGSILATYIAEAFVNKDSEYYSSLCMLLSMLIQSFGGVSLALFVNKKTPAGKEAEPIRSLFRKPQQSAWWIIRWIFIVLFFIYATNYATSFIFMFIENITGIKLVQTDFSADDNALSGIVNIICITFMAPFFEEVLVRGAMLGNSKKYGTWSAAIATGLFFGLLHMNYPQVPFAAVMGFFSAFLVLKTKSIFPSILVHFIVNSIGGIQSLFVGRVDAEAIMAGDISAAMENPVPFIILMLIGLLILGLLGIGLIFFIIEIVKFRDSFKLEKVYPEVSEGKKLLHYFSSPLTIVLMLFYITMTVLNALPE